MVGTSRPPFGRKTRARYILALKGRDTLAQAEAPAEAWVGTIQRYISPEGA